LREKSLISDFSVLSVESSHLVGIALTSG